MGVKGLWPLMAPAAKERNLAGLAINEGFNNVQRGRAYRLGIDVSIWFEELQQVKGLRPSANTGQNTVLQLFYRRLVYLLSLPVLAFFVFEGGGRPDFKRGKGVLKKNHWMQNGAEYLIEAFGFEHCTAPGEAEAELAAMNAAGHINAIVTNDVDSFLFGGLTVMRTWNIKKDKGQVTTYNADDIAHDVNVEMTRDGAVLFGLLNGGDYDSGLPGCGAQTALGVIKYGLGATLCAAARSKGHAELMYFLIGWRNHLREILRTDPHNFIGRRNPACALNVTDTFPDLGILHTYLNPLTSVSCGKTLPSVNTNGHLPDVARIGQLCERYFEWATPIEILPHFLKHVWPGVVLRMIQRDILEADRVRETEEGIHKVAGPSSSASIPDVIRSRTLASGIPECKVQFPVAKLTAATLSSLQELQQPHNIPGSSNSKRQQQGPASSDPLEVWVPSTIFRTWIAGQMSDALMMADDGDSAIQAPQLASPPPSFDIADNVEREVDVDLTTPPTENTCHISDGLIIDLTYKDKVVFDLTELE